MAATKSKRRGVNGASRETRVTVRVEDVVIPTYLPAVPDKNPMFLEKRVYQGSSGKVYPLPFTDRIAERPVPRRWKAVWIENQFLRVMVLPELGGRIHVLQDKTNGYDLIYRQAVIKPALVGLAGPWISGGIEFNWPQHHRPATFLPVDFELQTHSDGSKTVWCSDHDPMLRMKGMHGVGLHPGKAYLELKVRAYNRTPLMQTFLWWANVATRVHESYQSFFPPDVFYVADHARRSMSEYPLCEGFYYGVNYAERGHYGVPMAERPRHFVPWHCGGNRTPGGPEYRPNDLSFYANIPTPCSYMCMESKEDFFGGYDFAAQAGIVHWANHHIAPGKKQWTWGNHEFGYAWDRNLTDKDQGSEYAPYIELMAGVYTDNQPDFSFLRPGETKIWSQYWYPIQRIGPPQQANLEGAISLRRVHGKWTLGIAVTRHQPRARIRLMRKEKLLVSFTRDLSPSRPILEHPKLSEGSNDLRICVADADGRELIACEFKPRGKGEVPPAATEPPAPAEIGSADELYLTGLHLEQYRHATRCPTVYWREALRRDPFDSRCNNAMGLWHLRRGEFGLAEAYLRKAIERLTRRNPNPRDCEAYYNLGLCLRYLGQDEAAYSALYKATWDQNWVSAAAQALAELDCAAENWAAALDHLELALRFNTRHTRARDLKVMVLRKLGRFREAGAVLRQTLEFDPLDWWARYLNGEPLRCDLQTSLDLVIDLMRAGLYREAIGLLYDRLRLADDGLGKAALDNAERAKRLPDQSWGATPLVHYYLGWLNERIGKVRDSKVHYQRAAAESPDYCFPARLEEIGILEAAMRANPSDARAPYYLGNLLYDRRRHGEALRLWERASRLEPRSSVVWRNLGIGYFNIQRKPGKAVAAYAHAIRVNPDDARLLYERDQLWKRLGYSPAKRLRSLARRLDLVRRRDDLSVELCALYNQVGRSADALAVINSRHFQPWEGGEGGPLGQYVRSHLALGRAALAVGEAARAREHFELALKAPANLGEARHLLANQSDVLYWLGCACDALGGHSEARKHWLRAATFKGDFQEMRVRAFSEMTYFSAMAYLRLRRVALGRKLLMDLLAYGRKLAQTPATIDYFATSLPAMLLFEDDLPHRQETTALFLQGQALLGLGRIARGESLLRRVLRRDPNHPLAADLIKDL